MVYWGRTKGTAADCGPSPLGTHEHSRVLFLILGSGLPLLNRVGAEFIGATRKERPCFAAERGLDRFGHTSFRHRKGTALFCCRMRPRPLWAHMLHLPFDWRADARTTTAHANGSTLPGSALMHLPGAPLTPRRHLSASSGCHRPEKLGSRSEELLATELLAPTSGRTAVRRCVCVRNASYTDPGGYAAGAVVATAPRRVRHLSESP